MEPGEKRREGQQLQRKRDEVRRDNRGRHNQTRKVHLAEKVRVGDERRATRGQILREVIPAQQSAKIKKRRRQAISRNARDASENNGEDKRGEGRLEHEPKR